MERDDVAGTRPIDLGAVTSETEGGGGIALDVFGPARPTGLSDDD